jgi:ATP-dependent Lon protease
LDSTATATPLRKSFGSSELDASLLLMPLVGFLPPDDPRVRGTIAAIEQELMVDEFVLRYRTKAGIDGLAPGEGVFLPCSFWLADNYTLQEEGKDDLAEIEDKIKKTKLSKEAREKATHELTKLRQMSPMSAESTVVRNYLDWLLSIPWAKRTKIKKDLKLAQEVLGQ